MCGIVGLFLKDQSLMPSLGLMLTNMLITMTERGPDSAGIAIYDSTSNKDFKLTVQSGNPEVEFRLIKDNLSAMIESSVSVEVKDTHAVIKLSGEKITLARQALAKLCPAVRVMSVGEKVEIYKEVGLPRQVVDVSRFQKCLEVMELVTREWQQSPL